MGLEVAGGGWGEGMKRCRVGSLKHNVNLRLGEGGSFTIYNQILKKSTISPLKGMHLQLKIFWVRVGSGLLGVCLCMGSISF